MKTTDLIQQLTALRQVNGDMPLTIDALPVPAFQLRSWSQRERAEYYQSYLDNLSKA